jgi:hypothetical protein
MIPIYYFGIRPHQLNSLDNGITLVGKKIIKLPASGISEENSMVFPRLPLYVI